MNALSASALPGAGAHKIASVVVSHHRLELNPPFNASWDTKPRVHFDATLVRVTTDAGLSGVGSGDLMLGFAGHENLFVGHDPLALERHFRVLSNIDFHYGRCWPLDLALWDLAGKILGVPCWKLLGGLSDRVRAYASSGTLRDPSSDTPFLEFPFDPPEWSLERRDFLMAEPFTADPEGWISLSDAPGMGYILDESRLLATRIA